jgi:predicted small lipoprotein YifL
MKRLATVLFLITAAACGRAPPLRSIDASKVIVDAGQLEKPSQCNVAFGGPQCCGPDNRSVGTAACIDGDYVCTTGVICGCGGQPQTFYCSDFCGSDAYVNPVCGGSGWICPGGLIQTNQCPANTCWGEPGDLCQLPQCVNGAWSCESDGGINDPV